MPDRSWFRIWSIVLPTTRIPSDLGLTGSYYSPPVPDLVQAGYPLRGGRIDMLDHRPVAAIVYEHGKHIINLFVWPSGDRKLDIGLQSQRGYHFYAWNVSGFNFFCISDVSGPDLDAFEHAVRDHLNL
ncbi:MAG TPA: hypothetical protein VGH55_09125 [Chthoniobacterales bacterium]